MRSSGPTARAATRSTCGGATRTPSGPSHATRNGRSTRSSPSPAAGASGTCRTGASRGPLPARRGRGLRGRGTRLVVGQRGGSARLRLRGGGDRVGQAVAGPPGRGPVGGDLVAGRV